MIYQTTATVRKEDILSDAEYLELSARNDRFCRWVDNNQIKAYKPEEVPENARVTNEERSKLEVYLFLLSPPDRYFCYISEGKKSAATWMGQNLSHWCILGREWRSNMGDKRQNVIFRGINGRFYSGIYYKSSGEYARVRALSIRSVHARNIAR